MSADGYLVGVEEIRSLTDTIPGSFAKLAAEEGVTAAELRALSSTTDQMGLTVAFSAEHVRNLRARR